MSTRTTLSILFFACPVSIDGLGLPAVHKTVQFEEKVSVEYSPIENLTALGAQVDQLDKSIQESHGQHVIWVNGYARSGTSVFLSMFSMVNTHKVFSLFEPCHFSGDNNDKVDGWLQQLGCEGLLHQISHCKFRGIRNLHGWKNEHTLKPGLGDKEDYGEYKAQKSCQSASAVVFKTINVPLEKSSIHTFDDIPLFHVISVIRDPRSVYASVKKQFLYGKSDLSQMSSICAYMLQSSRVEHDRLIHIVFEDFVRTPELTMRKAYQKMGVEFGKAQLDWIHENVNAKNCDDLNTAAEADFTDCHTQSSLSISGAWRYELSTHEKTHFTIDKQCRKLADRFGYKPW